MATTSPLAVSLRTLTRVLVLSLGILGLVGSGVAMAVWSQAGRVADRSVPLQEVASDALLHYQGIAGKVPLLTMATTDERRTAVMHELNADLREIDVVSQRGESLGLPKDQAVLDQLQTHITNLGQLTHDGITRAASQQATITAALSKTDQLVTATTALGAALTKVRANAKTQVGASQRRSVLVNDRIKALLGTRRALAQVDLWLERSLHTDSVEALKELTPRFTTNADLLEAISTTLGDDLHEDIVKLADALRHCTTEEGVLGLLIKHRQTPQDQELSKRLVDATATFSTSVASLSNRTGTMIEELDNEVEEAKNVAKTALATMQQASDAYDGAAALGTNSRTLGSNTLALARATSPAAIAKLRDELNAIAADMTATIARISPVVTSLGLAKERRAIDEYATNLAPLMATLTGPDGLATQVNTEQESRRRIEQAQTAITGLLETKLQIVTTAATGAKDQARKTMQSLKDLSVLALGLLLIVSTIALLVAWRRSRSIGNSILQGEEHQLQRAAVLAHLVQQIEAQVTPLSQASNGLSTTSQSLNQRAQGDETQAQGVAASSLAIARATEEVTRSAREIQASITSISDDAQTTQRSAEEATQAAREATALISELASASEAIAQSTVGVTAIANQTRLLALNAAIEAASAGAAGRGFAVVANEVKGLALQTATENQQIATRVAAVQAAMTRAKSAIERIDGAVSQASEGQARIAAAVEQQTATTTEMVGRLAEISSGLAETAQAMTVIAGNAGTTSRESMDLTALASQLHGMASELDTLVKSQSASAAHAVVRV